MRINPGASTDGGGPGAGAPGSTCGEQRSVALAVRHRRILQPGITTWKSRAGGWGMGGKALILTVGEPTGTWRGDTHAPFSHYRNRRDHWVPFGGGGWAWPLRLCGERS